MNECTIEKCIIEPIDENFYFHVILDRIQYNYLSLTCNDRGSICLKTPYFFCPCLDGMIDFYSIDDPEKIKIITMLLWEYAKKVPMILDMIRKKSNYYEEIFWLP